VMTNRGAKRAGVSALGSHPQREFGVLPPKNFGNFMCKMGRRKTALLWHSIQGLYRHKRVNFVCVMDGVNGVDGDHSYPYATKTYACYTLTIF